MSSLDSRGARLALGKKDEAWERYRWRMLVPGQKISAHEADVLCVHLLGLHPCLVYGAAWWVEGTVEAPSRHSTLSP